jgi:hypothetical protein
MVVIRYIAELGEISQSINVEYAKSKRVKHNF